MDPACETICSSVFLPIVRILSVTKKHKRFVHGPNIQDLGRSKEEKVKKSGEKKELCIYKLPCQNTQYIAVEMGLGWKVFRKWYKYNPLQR